MWTIKEHKKKPEVSWAVAIDLTEDGMENEPLLESPRFDTEEEADAWYRKLKISYCNLDIIMVKYNDANEVLDSYILG